MSAKVRNLHDIQYCGLCEPLYPQLGDYVRVLTSHLHQVSIRCEHRVDLPVTEIQIVVLQRWALSQLASNHAYPLRDVCGDQCVLEVPWDVVVVDHAIQGRDINRQDQQDLLHISQIVTVISSLLSSGVTMDRMTSSQGGIFQSPS
jgi:hypothetical protein